MENEVAKLKEEGMSMEDIARKKVQQRNQERIESYIKSDNLEGLKAMKERNLIEYGRAEGPTADQLFKSKGSWDEVIYGSVKSSAAMDVLVVLY